MSDPIDMRKLPGADAAAETFSTVSKSIQSITSEIQKLSKDSMDQATQLMEKLRTAKSMEDIVSIQSSFMQTSFSTYADYTKRMSEMMMSVPVELAKQSQSAFQQGKQAMTEAAEKTGEQMRNAAEQMGHHHG